MNNDNRDPIESLIPDIKEFLNSEKVKYVTWKQLKEISKEGLKRTERIDDEDESIRMKKIEEKINEIKEVLNKNVSMDFNFDFIKESSVKEKLISDHLEMKKCRIGVKDHNEGFDFENFCLFLHYQVELLINHYIKIKKLEVYPKNSYYTSPSFYDKLHRIQNEVGLTKSSVFHLKNVYYVRNKLNHRSEGLLSDEEDNEIQELENKQKRDEKEDYKLKSLKHGRKFRREKNVEKAESSLNEFFEKIKSNY